MLRLLKIATVSLGGFGLLGCSAAAPDPRTHGSASLRLKPVTAPLAPSAIRRTVYVPVYSSIYWGLDSKQSLVELAATVSVRNVSPRYPLVLDSVRYYDSAGKQVREYVSVPSELAPLATVEFVIQQRDAAGGPGANFLVQWSGSPDMNEPLVEAVMVGQTGNAGISFTSAGRVLKDEPEP